MRLVLRRLGMALLWVGILSAGPARAKPIPARGREVPELRALDELLIGFLEKENVPGVTLAVAKDGRLVYARGFGYANLPDREPVEPDALFRIASISKPITAAAVYRLVEDGKLSLDDKVLDVLRPDIPRGTEMDGRWKEITIRHLIEHKGGWDRAKSGDPMFRSVRIAERLGVEPPALQPHIIRSMLTRPLDFDPGSRRAYSNFGYCVLGRVIEKASNKPYEKYVQERILKPLGIRDMRLGKTLIPAKREVRYYDFTTPSGKGVFPGMLDVKVAPPYGRFCLEAMDSHGGWIASAIDLVRFGSALHQPERFPVFREEVFRSAFRPPYDHAGALWGTSTLLYLREDGVTWALLCNTRKINKDDDVVMALRPRILETLNKVSTWPTGDLFDDTGHNDAVKKPSDE